MCGITGFFNQDGTPGNLAFLERMIGMVSHRGPDGVDVYLDGSLGLGHRRLSIIDLPGGKQPMHDGSGSFWIVFNGEIFNFIELRNDLTKKGHRFRTRTDTEVILKLYEEYGTDCVHHMNGQWAFAIWDKRRRRLFLSRDRLGIKPLFYTSTKGTFIFGSELKAILAHPDVNREIDVEALSQVFTFWFPLPARTIFKGVFELLPGHSMIVEGGQVHLYRYWQMEHPAAATWQRPSPETEQRHSEELRALLPDATQLRLRADVPVATYVSGGLDSSIVAALAKKAVGPALCSFSVAFESPGLDESTHQLEVVRNLETRHRMIRCSTTDIGRAFPEVLWHMETPVLRTAPVPLFLLSKLVHDSGFKVALTGEGADEFLGGYDIYKEAKVRAFWAARMDSRRRPLLLKRLYPYLNGIQKQSPAYLQAFFRVRPEDLVSPFFSHMVRWELTSKAQVFFSAPVREALRAYNPYEELQALLPAGFSTWHLFSRSQYLESAFLLPGYLLSSQGDRVAMAHGVETRYPFLDHRVAELSAVIPPDLKMKVLQEKYLLKKAFNEMVPASVLKRHKQPYRAPDATSFFDPVTGKARHAYVEELLSANELRSTGLFDPAAVQKLVEKARTGRAISFLDNAALVGVLSTQMVVDIFVRHFTRRLPDGQYPARVASVCG